MINPSSKIEERTHLAIDTPGLALLFLLTASYLLFGAPFAELHIELFQAIPVFVGEIVLTICLFLFSFRCFVSGPGVRQPVILSWIMFGFWILGKAVTGYFETKGYALRNAALFYYPFTALFVYVFAKDLVGRRKGLGDLFREPRLSLFFYFLGIFLALGQSVVMMEPFGRYSCLAVLAGFFLSFGRIWWVMGGLLVVLVGGIVAGALDCASRAHFISLLCASIFLVVYFFMAGRARKRIKWIVGVFSCLLLAAFIVSRSDPHTVKSLVTPGELFKLYQGFEERLQKEGSFYVAQPKEARIYNPDSAGFRARWFRPTGEPLNEDKASLPESGEVQESVLATTREPPQQEPRSLGIAYGNMLFRYYIWRDMTEEFFKERPFLFGFSFGKPQRSRSVEVLNCAVRA